MAETFYDDVFVENGRDSDPARPKAHGGPVLRIVDPDTGLRGKPKTATERLKHHLSVYERLAATANPADMRQMLELAAAIVHDSQDLAQEAHDIRFNMLANILGVNPKSISAARLELLMGELASR